MAAGHRRHRRRQPSASGRGLDRSARRATYRGRPPADRCRINKDARVIEFPVPGTGRVAVVVPAPGTGPGYWAGAPSAGHAAEGSLLIAYRLRTPGRRGASVVVATSQDDERLVTVATLDRERFGAESLERPALVRLDHCWRMYVSCATPHSKHWRIDVLDVDDPGRFGEATPRTVFPGDEHVGVKDPVIRRAGGLWHAWVCCHPLDDAGEED